MALSSAKHAFPPGTPPAIWARFAQQAAWKDWTIVALLTLNGLLVIAGARLAHREPDVVVIGPDGKSTYVQRSLAAKALLDFIADQRLQPSDVTVVRFTRDFVRLALSANSSTVDATWSEALLMMSPPLRQRLAAESERQKLLETYKQLRVRTVVDVLDVDLVERTKELLQVKASVRRSKAPLLDETAGGAQDRLGVELALRVLPRTLAHPDGLEVVEWKVSVLPDSPALVDHAK